MDEFKVRAGERFEAFQVAAKTAADNGKNKAEDIYVHATDTINRIKEALLEIWRHELIAESRMRVVNFSRDTVRRIKEGAPLLSPIVLYDELKALFKDRVWRRSMMIFACGLACGLVIGASAGIKYTTTTTGPHCRALHTQTDQSVMMLDDAVVPCAANDEVLVRIQSFSVCPLDRAILRGHSSVLRSLVTRTQLTVGRGFAGVVLDVGRDVIGLELGDEVWGCVSEWSGGAASELLNIRSSRLSKRPRSIQASEASSMPWAGSLALAAIDKIEDKEKIRIAILGGASGESALLIQLLRMTNAHLTVMAPRHALSNLQDLGANETVELDCSNAVSHPPWWRIETHASRSGPWDYLVLCSGGGCPGGNPNNVKALLKSTAPRNAIIDLRPKTFITDRLPMPVSTLFAATFYTFRMLRWLTGFGTNTDWLENQYCLSDGLDRLASLVDNKQLAPVLDKVYLPQDFESALAHACSDDSIGTTVIRFP